MFIFFLLELFCYTPPCKHTPVLQQLREGLELYQLLSVMQRKPKECWNLFMIGDDDKVK